MTHGVGEKINQHPRCFVGVGFHGGQVGGQVEFYTDISLCSSHLQRIRGIVHNVGWINRLDDQLNLSRLHLRHIEQFARDVKQAVGIVADMSDQVALFVVELANADIVQQFQAHFNARNGRFQLVRDSGNEVSFGQIEFFKGRNVL